MIDLSLFDQPQPDTLSSLKPPKDGQRQPPLTNRVTVTGSRKLTIGTEIDQSKERKYRLYSSDHCTSDRPECLEDQIEGNGRSEDTLPSTRYIWSPLTLFESISSL